MRLCSGLILEQDISRKGRWAGEMDVKWGRAKLSQSLQTGPAARKLQQEPMDMGLELWHFSSPPTWIKWVFFKKNCCPLSWRLTLTCSKSERSWSKTERKMNCQWPGCCPHKGCESAGEGKGLWATKAPVSTTHRWTTSVSAAFLPPTKLLQNVSDGPN